MPRTPRVKRAPQPREPRTLERAYAAALAKLTRDMADATRVALRPALARASRRNDADAADFASIDWAGLRLRLGRIAARGARLVDQFGRKIQEFNTGDIARILNIDLSKEPPAVQAALEAWRRENVALISSIAEKMHGDVRDVVQFATTRGTRVETLARMIEGRYAVSTNRARLIARDQVGKANAALTFERQREAGITRYAWSTSRDERVRPMHKALEGQIFSWTDPPVTNEKGERNHPGGDISCRCVAIAILDD